MKGHSDLYCDIIYARFSLGRALREMVGVIVSSFYRCLYCIQHYGQALKHYRENRERVG